jgi:hypothetical protein
MPRQNSDGKYIISAGEVGSYSVCPEAWRLQMIEKRTATQGAETSATGSQLHKEWATELSEAVYLTRTIRLVVLLILLTILITMLRYS